MPREPWKPIRSIRALIAFLFRDLSQEEFRKLFGPETVNLLRYQLRGWEESAVRHRHGILRFLSKVGFLIRRLLEQMSPVRRFLFIIAFLLAMASMFGRGPLPFYALGILTFLLLLEQTEKLLARGEIEIAREVQEGLFPERDPQITGWQVASRNIPANDVGGDYFDFIPIRRSGHLGIALGDVAGKGIGAALLVANLQATLRALLPIDSAVETAPDSEPGKSFTRNGADLESVFRRLNRTLESMSQDNRFASLVYGELDPRSGRFVYVNAGHNPPLLTRADGRQEGLPVGGLVLGVLTDAGYRAGEVTLAPGDTLTLYCDGVTERWDDDGMEFGEKRLREVLARLRGQGAAEIRDGILRAVEHHAGKTPPHDDVTVVVLVREGGKVLYPEFRST
ncbi:MAG: PP2C family protein-serine/threonine phosphatase [Acidobacteriota bacterium]